MTGRHIHVPIVDVESKNISYSESVSVALGIQHAKRMRHIVTGFHDKFPHNIKEAPIFGKKLLYIKCVFCFSLPVLSATFPF